jgi:hypothetical protein
MLSILLSFYAGVFFAVVVLAFFAGARDLD